MKRFLLLAALVLGSTTYARADEPVRDGDGFLEERSSLTIDPSSGSKAGDKKRKQAKTVIKGIKVDNRLGDVEVVGSDDPGISLHVVKRAKDGETLERLKVNLLVPEKSGILEIGSVLLAGDEATPVVAGTIRIDIVLHVPRKALVDVKAWNGKVTVTGMRSGAALLAHDAQITVTDVVGTVTTQSTRGQQRLTGVKGAVVADATFGHMALDGISGDSLAANVHDGTIVATRIESRSVNLTTTYGNITFTGELYAGGNYDLRSYKGDVEIRVGAKASFRIDAYAREGVLDSQLELADGAKPSQGRLQGTFGSKKKPALLEVSSTVGRVTIGLVND